jgi:large subunit ribosomal protein L32
MAALPKKQLSKSKQRSRAAHYKFRPPALSRCPQCHSLKLPNHVCLTCGFYAGRAVIQVGKKKE